MNSLAAFVLGELNRHRERMVFDWDRAAKIIRDRNAVYAFAGLDQDWEYTGGLILDNGEPLLKNETNIYVASTWATPLLVVDGDIMSCFRMESEVPGWNQNTYWPNSALKILGKSLNQAT